MHTIEAETETVAETPVAETAPPIAENPVNAGEAVPQEISSIDGSAPSAENSAPAVESSVPENAPIAENRTVQFSFVIPKGHFSKKEFAEMNGLSQPGANDVINTAHNAGFLKIVGKKAQANPLKPGTNLAGKPTIFYDLA